MWVACHKKFVAQASRSTLRRDLMAIRKPELGCFPDSFGPLGAHTQRKTSVTHLESTKKIQAFPDDFRGLSDSGFRHRKVMFSG